MDSLSKGLYNKELEKIRIDHFSLIKQLTKILNEWRNFIEKEFETVDSDLRDSSTKQSRSVIFERFWEKKFATTDDYVKKMIKNIKNKLEDKEKSKSEYPYNTKELRDEYKNKIINWEQRSRIEMNSSIDLNESKLIARKTQRSGDEILDEEKSPHDQQENNLIQETNNREINNSDVDDINKIFN
jgi:hypothetical protein